MSTIKSPFHIINDFLSPKNCDEILKKVQRTVYDTDKEGKPLPYMTINQEIEQMIFPRLEPIFPELEERYDANYVGTEHMMVFGHPEDPKNPAVTHGCDNSKYVRRKWVRYKDVDLTAILWLKDYNNVVPIDPRTEVYGGKLEFPVYNFSFTPQRGTLVFYPAGPHFITATSPVLVSDLYYIKFNIKLTNKDGSIWLYQPSNFPYDKKRGLLQSWFAENM